MVELHAAGPQSEDELGVEPRRQKQGRDRCLGREERIDQVGTLADKKPPQSCERGQRIQRLDLPIGSSRAPLFSSNASSAPPA